MWYIVGIIASAFGLATYVIGLFLGALWGKARHRLTDKEFKALKLAYEEVLESLNIAIESGDVQGVQKYTLLKRELEDLAERQGRKLEPKPPPLPTT